MDLHIQVAQEFRGLAAAADFDHVRILPRTREGSTPRDISPVPSAERRPQDPAEKARARTEAQLAEQTAISDMQWLMGDVRGRRFVHRLLERAGIYRLSFTGEAQSTAFNEGARNSGLRLMNELLRHCPKRLSEMQRENLKHERSDFEPSTGTSGDSGSTSGQPG